MLKMKYKDQTKEQGTLTSFKPELGDNFLLFVPEDQTKPRKVFIRDLETCFNDDEDLLQKAIDQGYNSDIDTNFHKSGGVLHENKISKIFYSRNYNYIYHKKNGFFMRWGNTKEDDPVMSIHGPEIADIEISTICHGIKNKPCKWCYKSNTGSGDNMSLETFKKVFEKLPQVLTQIAFGIGDIDGNPDLWNIFEHCMTNGITPNVTINGDRMTDEDYDKLVNFCGAVAVSCYDPNDVCFDAVHELTKRGLSQTNIHKLLSEETYEECLDLIDKVCTDPRLENLNAIVFLALKERGRGTCMHSLRDTERYKQLVAKAFKAGVAIGFDSCSAPTFLKSVQDYPNYEELEQLSEPCESTLFSIYIDVYGNVWPCSFLENCEYEPINLLEIDNFKNDCWHHEKLNKFRRDLLATTKCEKCLVAGVRQCPVYDLY